MTTNVPQIQFTPTGLVVPTEAAVLAGVQQDINLALGGGVNPGLNTPQGQLASTLAAAISNSYALYAALINGIDPDFSTGFMQDAIARLYFLNRDAGVPTVVACTCAGLTGTIIPTNNAFAVDTVGNLYVCTSGGTIPTSGSITLTFSNVANGPIACGAGTLTNIFQAITGWESITNPADGILGTLVEQPAAFEFRREQSIAANAHGSADAIFGAVFEVPGVTDCFVYENFTNSSVLIGSTNFSLTPHSIFVGVIGGLATAVAQAIWTKKDLGCDMNGNTSETVVDTNYSAPQPTYTIKFNNNALNAVAYNLTVNIKNSSLLPSTIVQDVRNACIAQFNGTNSNGQRVRIGSLFLAAQFYGPVATCEGPSIPVQVLTIYIGSAFSGTGTLVATSNVLTIVSVVSGTLTPGTPVTDAASSIPAGTTIVQQLTGTPGGDGTYQMSAVASTTQSSAEAITGTSTGTAQLIGIDQAPELGAITVNLV